MRYKIGSISILLVTIFVLLIEGCATTFLTPNIKQPVTLSKKIGINGLEIPSDVKTKGSIYGEILLERTYSQTSSSTEEKASAEVEFLSCLQASNSRFASNLSFKVIGFQYILFAGGKAEIDYTADCYELPNKNK